MVDDPVGTVASVFLFALAIAVGLGVIFYYRLLPWITKALEAVGRWAAGWWGAVALLWRGFRMAWREARERRRES